MYESRRPAKEYRKRPRYAKEIGVEPGHGPGPATLRC